MLFRVVGFSIDDFRRCLTNYGVVEAVLDHCVEISCCLCVAVPSGLLGQRTLYFCGIITSNCSNSNLIVIFVQKNLQRFCTEYERKY